MILNTAVSITGKKCVTHTVNSNRGSNSITIEFNVYGEYIVFAACPNSLYNNPRYGAPKFDFVTSTYGTVRAEALADGVWRVFNEGHTGTMVLQKNKSGFGIAMGCAVIGDWSDEEAPTFS